MKDEAVKKAIKANFLKVAPADFTQKLMVKMEQEKSAQKSLLPKKVFWALGMGFVSFTLLVVFLRPSIELPFSLSQANVFIAEFMQVLILPLCISTLLFIKQFIDYWRLSKH